MSEPELDPYAPPSSEVNVPLPGEERWRKVDRRLRWTGALCMGGLFAAGLVLWGTGTMVLNLIVMGTWCAIAAGFLYGGGRWHLGIAVFMLFLVMIQVVSAVRSLDAAVQFGVPMDAVFWGNIVLGFVICGVPAGCGIALFVRGRKGR